MRPDRLRRVGWQLVPMGEREARAIAGWQYPAPFDFYNLSADPEVITELTDGSYWAAVDGRGQVAAFFCTGDAALVPDGLGAGAYGTSHPVVDIGVGLRPDLTSHRLGGPFMMDVMDRLAGNPCVSHVRLTVATMNERAVRLYQRLGFVATGVFDSRGVEFMVMERPLAATAGQAATQEGEHR